MTIPVNIDDLVNRRIVESARIEFKSGFNPNAVIHTICAFANDIDNIGGGYLVLGVEEKDGSPVLPPKGIPQGEIDGILKKMVGFCHRIEPLYNPIAEPVLFQGAYLVVIWVPGGHGRPYKACKDVHSAGSAKHYYIRKFSSTVVASPDEEKELFYISTDIPFDDRPNLLARVDDLDLGLMRQHLKKIGSDLYEHSAKLSTLDLARDMQLVSGPVEDVRPLNVGVLMFTEHPERFFRYARIEVVDIPDPTGANMVEKVFTGPIQRQLGDALAYIKNYVIKEKVTKRPDRAEAARAFNYPYAAVEEILANAVYHRSYQISEPITVRITPESLEVTSFPGFDRSISDEDVAERRIRARSYRNRRIGDFLKELRLIEGRNTGFPNAYKALEANGSPDLEFFSDEQRGFLSVAIPVHPAFAPKQKAGSEKARLYEQRILDALEQGDLTLTDLARAMGYKGISKKLSKTVEALEATGVLERRIPEGSTRVLIHWAGRG
ncbi:MULTISPECIES: RNA-binding domain-containing protein [unclassified Adlercreutzia]|uniref:RNA-binding domain-containing protein n=1 Tax=unclassified Adlercreutzia TaxID=2636013 RepID=UPI0013EAB81B|nr:MULTISPECIES: RNA-binding domain-containing protein [unclassified Adlercreutzia]